MQGCRASTTQQGMACTALRAAMAARESIDGGQKGSKLTELASVVG